MKHADLKSLKKFNLTYNDNKLNFYSNITINSAPVAKSSP